MIAVEGADPCQPRFRGLPDRELGREVHHHVAHAVVPVHERRHRVLADGMHLRMEVDPVQPDPLAVVVQAEDAVRIDAAEVRIDHAGGAERRIRLRKPQCRQRGRAEGLQPLCRENLSVCLCCHT